MQSHLQFNSRYLNKKRIVDSSNRGLLNKLWQLNILIKKRIVDSSNRWLQIIVDYLKKGTHSQKIYSKEKNRWF